MKEEGRGGSSRDKNRGGQEMRRKQGGREECKMKEVKFFLPLT